MKGYRLYRFNGAGHFASCEIIPAETDTHALRAANELLAGDPGELWLERRLVGRLAAQMGKQA